MSENLLFDGKHCMFVWHQPHGETDRLKHIIRNGVYENKINRTNGARMSVIPTDKNIESDPVSVSIAFKIRNSVPA